MHTRFGGITIFLNINIFQYPGYVFNLTTIAGDAAVLELSRPANLSNPYIGTVELVVAGSDFAGEECIITGWGRKGIK